ncbi:MAG: hypothetical protein WCJ45_06210 [bacterium]
MNTKEKTWVELLSGVPLFVKVLEVLKSQVFLDSDELLSEGDTIVGIMSPLERACFTVLKSSGNDALSALDSCPHDKPGSRCVDFDEGDPLFCPYINQPHCPHFAELKVIKADAARNEKLFAFLSSLIQSRLQTRSRNISVLHLNKDFRISTPEEIDAPDTIEMFESFSLYSSEDLLDISLKGTFLESILSIVLAKKFTYEKQRITKNDIAIRDMSIFEKALQTLLTTVREDLKTKQSEFLKLMDGIDIAEALFDLVLTGNDPLERISSQLEVFSQKIPLLEAQEEYLNTFFWMVVKSNMSQEQIKTHTCTGFRGSKIVVSDLPSVTVMMISIGL